MYIILVSALGPNPSFIQLGGLLGQGLGLGLGPGLDNNAFWSQVMKLYCHNCVHIGLPVLSASVHQICRSIFYGRRL